MTGRPRRCRMPCRGPSSTVSHPSFERASAMFVAGSRMEQEVSVLRSLRHRTCRATLPAEPVPAMRLSWPARRRPGPSAVPGIPCPLRNRARPPSCGGAARARRAGVLAYRPHRRSAPTSEHGRRSLRMAMSSHPDDLLCLPSDRSGVLRFFRRRRSRDERRKTGVRHVRGRRTDPHHSDGLRRLFREFFRRQCHIPVTGW